MGHDNWGYLGWRQYPEISLQAKQVGEKLILIDGQLRRVRVFESHYEILRSLGMAENDARRPTAKIYGR